MSAVPVALPVMFTVSMALGAKELAKRAVEVANKTFQTWRHTRPEQRADLLFRVAALLRERKHEMSAWMIHEVAKTWAEADGDTAEAIGAFLQKRTPTFEGR